MNLFGELQYEAEGSGGSNTPMGISLHILGCPGVPK